MTPLSAAFSSKNDMHHNVFEPIPQLDLMPLSRLTPETAFHFPGDQQQDTRCGFQALRSLRSCRDISSAMWRYERVAPI